MERNGLASPDLVATIYDAAVANASWQDVARLMAASVDAHQSILIMASRPGEESVTSYGIDPDIHDRYLELLDKDVWLNRMYDKPAPTIVRSDELIPLADLRKTIFFNELCVPSDVAYMAGVIAANQPGNVMIYACQRSRARGAFSAAEAERLAAYARHMAAARFLQMRLARKDEEIRRLRSVLDRSRFGVVMSDETGAVSWQNAAATRVFRRSDGLSVRNGLLRATHHDDQLRLGRAISAAARTAGGSAADGGSQLLVRRRGRSRGYHVTVVPSDSRGQLDCQPSAIAFIVDPSSPPGLPASALRCYYGLTDAEARLCQRMAGGLTVREIADEFGTAVTTVRSQLKSVFRKCDVYSQPQLVRLLGSLDIHERRQPAGH